MIIEHYPSKKKKSFLPPINLYSYPKTETTKAITDAIIKEPNAFYAAQAKKQGCSVEEWLRRDAIVKKHFKECVFHAYDKVWPTKPEKLEQYGQVQIDNICYSYSQMDKDKWPENDNPLIVVAHTLKEPTYSFFCTTNFLQKDMPAVKEQNGSA